MRDPEPRRAGTVWLRFLLAGAALAVILAVGFQILDRLRSIDQRLAMVDQRVEEVEGQAAVAATSAASARDAADLALDRAAGAEENAAQAARTRDAAEELMRLAEQAREAAQEATADAEAAAAAANQEALRAQAELDRLTRERQAELDRLEAALSSIVETRRTALGLVMNLGNDAIEFEFDRATLQPRDRELLSRIAGILLTSSGFSVAVYGHTDDVGSTEYNQALSERRARAVRDYLVEAGVSEGIISTQGLGKSSPRVDATSAEGRARNRRVEIAIIDVNIGPARVLEVP
jgi:outer membrane protein OmpA-like peptidoglycan-associated protein